MINIILLRIELIKCGLGVDHKLLELDLLQFLFFHYELTLGFVKLLAHALHLLIRVLLHLLLLSLQQLIDL